MKDFPEIRIRDGRDRDAASTEVGSWGYDWREAVVAGGGSRSGGDQHGQGCEKLTSFHVTSFSVLI